MWAATSAVRNLAEGREVDDEGDEEELGGRDNEIDTDESDGSPASWLAHMMDGTSDEADADNIGDKLNGDFGLEAGAEHQLDGAASSSVRRGQWRAGGAAILPAIRFLLPRARPLRCSIFTSASHSYNASQ